jgi:quercetin dioxygenase-like cupin family protein
MGEQGDGWRAAAIDDVPPVKADWPATWKSIRSYFDITAFGINGVTKEAGNVLIPEHDHGATGEQEIYIVTLGEAKATLDGVEVAVPAGVAVATEGPVRRKFEAVASPTTLIVVGGVPGKAYEVGDWEK